MRRFALFKCAAFRGLAQCYCVSQFCIRKAAMLCVSYVGCGVERIVLHIFSKCDLYKTRCS